MIAFPLQEPAASNAARAGASPGRRGEPSPSIIYTTSTDCTGTFTVSQPESGTLNNAGTVRSTLNKGQVTALMLDVTTSGKPTDYTLVYVDTSVNPNRLYFGRGDELHGGTSPETRPNFLDSSRYFERQ